MAVQVKNNVNLNKNYLINAGIERLTAHPASPNANQIYINSNDNSFWQYNGSAWVVIGRSGSMTFKGTVGTGGTVTDLPTVVANIDNGDTYVVCTEGTYASKHAVVGDMFIANKDVSVSPATVTWQYVPSGNDKYTEVITGDDTTTNWTISHSLNTKAVMVEVYDTSTGSAGERIITDVEHTSVDTVTIKFGVAPAAGEKYTVVVLA